MLTVVNTTAFVVLTFWSMSYNSFAPWPVSKVAATNAPAIFPVAPLSTPEAVISPTTWAWPLAVISPVRNKFLNFLVAEPKSTSLVVVGVRAPSVKINCSVEPILKDIPVSATASKCPSASEFI